MYNQEQLRKKFNRLPEAIKEAIASVETADTIRSISYKYNLHVDQMGELADETGLLMLGLTKPQDYVDNLFHRLKTTYPKCKDIAKDVNEEIFKPIKESLMKVHNPMADEVEEELVESLVDSPTSQQENKVEEKSIFEEKMSNMFRSPQEKVPLEKTEDKLDTPPTPPKHVDPYREPVE
jgi:hypothetical protein